MNEITALPMKPGDAGQQVRRLPSPFAAGMDFPCVQAHWETLSRSHFIFLLFCLLQDFSGTKSAWIAGGFQSALTVKWWLTLLSIPQKHSQSHFPPGRSSRYRHGHDQKRSLPCPPPKCQAPDSAQKESTVRVCLAAGASPGRLGQRVL